MPGDPVTYILGESIVLSDTAVKAYRRQLGLDRPLEAQFLQYWRSLGRGDLGYSYYFHSPVRQLIADRLPWTVALVGSAVVLGLAIGGPLGALAGWNRRGLLNRAGTPFWLALYCVPPYLLGLLLLYLFAFRWRLLPFKGFYETGGVADVLRHLCLPVLVMTLFLSARNYTIMRGSVILEKGKIYPVFARAKGLFNREILWRHVLKNAASPLVTLIALDFGFILNGALFMEMVFSLNGMGALIYEAINARDYPVLQGVLLSISLMVIAVNILADLAYLALDPRCRAGRPV